MTETSNKVPSVVAQESKEKCPRCGILVATNVEKCPDCKHYMWGDIESEESSEDD